MQVEFIILDVILAVQAIVIIGVAVFFFLSWKHAKESNKVNGFVESVLPKVDEILEGIRQLVKASQPAGDQLVDFSKELKEIAVSSRESVHSLSDAVRDVSSTVRRQVRKADSIVTENLERVESISDEISERIIGPLGEIAALLKGGAVAVKYLRGVRTSTSEHGNGHHEDGQDDERTR